MTDTINKQRIKEEEHRDLTWFTNNVLLATSKWGGGGFHWSCTAPEPTRPVDRNLKFFGPGPDRKNSVSVRSGPEFPIRSSLDLLDWNLYYCKKKLFDLNTFMNYIQLNFKIFNNNILKGNFFFDPYEP